MPADDSGTDAVVALIASLVGRIETRRVFGAVGLFLRAAQFGLISGGKLFFYTDRLNRGDYDRAERMDEVVGDDTMGFCPRHDMPGDLPWREVPAFVLDEAEVLRTWTLAAWEAAKRSAKSRSGK